MIATLLAKRRIPKAIEALNQRDVGTFLKGFAEDAVLIHPGEVPGVSGEHRGKEALRAFYEHELELFPQLRLTVKHVAVSNIFDMIGNNVVATNWEADVTNREGFRLLNSGVSIMTIRRRQIIRMQNYVFDTGEKFLTAWGVTPSI